MCATAACEGQRTTWELVFFFYLINLGIELRLSDLLANTLHLLSHVTDPNNMVIPPV